MRKISIILLAILLLALPASAQGRTITGEEYAQAQTLPTILETVDAFSYQWYFYDENGQSSESLCCEKAEDGGMRYAIWDETGEFRYALNGMAYTRDDDTGALAALGYLGDSYALAEEGWQNELAWIPDEEIELTDQGDGSSAFDIYSTDADGTNWLEQYVVDTETLRLILYTCMREENGEYIPVTQVVADGNAAFAVPEELIALSQADALEVRVVYEDGSAQILRAPQSSPMYLENTEAYALYLDAERTDSAEDWLSQIQGVWPETTLYAKAQ